MFKFELGKVVRDRVTGFTGTITCRTEWLNRCVRYNVQPRMITKDGEQHKLPETQSFDEDQLELVADAVGFSDPVLDQIPVGAQRSSQRTGGDRESATRSPDPTR